MTTDGPTPTGASPTPGDVPRCYRHPDRETYIRCSRCNRPICPECMTSAPVGFQCPECVAAGRKEVRQPTTVVGGAIRHTGTDIVTKILIGINVLVWGVGLLLGTGSLTRELFVASNGAIQWDEITARFGLLMGYEQDRFPIGIVDGEWYRVITAAFVHEELWHIGFNMLALWMLGGALEPLLGRWRFITMYFVSAVAGSAASLLGAAPYSISIGASGAVFGLFGAYIVTMRRLGRDTTAVMGLLAVNLVYGFVVSGVDWRAHVGGLIAGLLLGAAFVFAPRDRRRALSVAASVVVGVAAIGTVILAVS